MDDVEKYAKQIETILDKYVHSPVNTVSVAKIREDLREIINTCEINKIDIHELFPVNAKFSVTGVVKFYQSGDVYVHQDNGDIICLHRGYGSDSICRNK